MSIRVAVMCFDKAGAQHVRLENRARHLAYIDASGNTVEQAGPFLDAEGQMIGSLLILSVVDMAEAEAWARNDPYAQAGLFEKVTLKVWKKVIGA